MFLETDRILKLHRMFGSTLDVWFAQDDIVEMDYWHWEDVTAMLEYMRDRLGAPLECKGTEKDPEGPQWRYRPAENMDYRLPGMWRDVWLLYWGKVEKAQKKAKRGPASGEDAEPRSLVQFIDGPVLPSLGLHGEIGPDTTHWRKMRFLRSVPESTALTEAEKVIYYEVGAALFERRMLRFEDPAAGGPGGRRARLVAVQGISLHHGHWTLDVQEDGTGPLQAVALERVQSPQCVEDGAQAPEADESALLAYQDALFGAVPAPRGKVTGALLRYNTLAARWGADETWHPDQHAHFRADGGLLMRIPQTARKPLVEDLFVHFDEVQLVAPEALNVDLDKFTNTQRRLQAQRWKQKQAQNARFLEMLEKLMRAREGQE